MSKKVAVSLDLLGNQIKNVVVDVLSSPPSASATSGGLYYDTNDKVLKYHDGTQWRTLARGNDFDTIKNFSTVKVGTTDIIPDNATGTLIFAGENITLTGDADNDKITFKITDANIAAALGYNDVAALTEATVNKNAYSKVSASDSTSISATDPQGEFKISSDDTAITTTAASLPIYCRV